MRKPIILGAAALAVLVLTASSCDGDGKSSSTNEEENVAEQQATGFLRSQPIPVFNWSQLRQNLIEIETAQANGTVTTSFFMSDGVLDPRHDCPSIGFPIPSTYQLTNPDKIEQPGPRERGTVTVAQMESTGAYTGDSAATYVICINADGDAYPVYWEGTVLNAGVPATWDYEQHHMVVTGEPTGEFTTGQNP